MDAHALLTSHGWRGTGHSLHATDDKIGLAKPLLLNRRDGNKGLGQKAHYTSDMWWMNAFDEQLQGLQQTTSKDGKIGVVQTVSNGRINSVEQGMGGRWKLNGNFVRGGFLQGTVEKLEASESSDEDTSSSDENEKSTGASTPVDEVKTEAKTETKEERRKRKAEKAARRAERDAKRKRKEMEKAKKRDAKKQRAAGAEPTSSESKEEKAKGSKREETKEERRARKESKRLRRAAREAKKAA
ncbi:hypothetical protein B0T11DRAFT_326671 [Plectosphaerella cucumerina]|jgi:nucleolar protein TMA23|uniref:Uncharacterized protein n=1 Tax=Plectosphaerella cucumerina TaxID=40658 RepID=A0A8K0TN16_9PEZI|nr:hypothetical protein B0T11DRAFT_326671 [Plectosphaerella cucumerina]